MMLAILLATLVQEPEKPLAFELVGTHEGALPSFVSAPRPTGAFARVVRRGKVAELRVEGGPGESFELSGSGWFLNWADFPAVARLEDGTALAAWLVDDPAHEHSYGTRFQIVEPGRKLLGEPRRLEEHAGPGEHGFVSLAALDERRFLALWLDGRAMDAHGKGEMQLLARKVDADGTLGPELVVDASTCSCCPTDLARLAPGTFLAVWRDRGPEEVRDISYAVFDGQRWSAPKPLHVDGWKIPGCPVNGPRIDVNHMGIGATWYTGVDGSVRASFGKADASSFGPAVRVDEGAADGRGDCVFLPDGSLLVGWMARDEGQVAWWLRRVWPDGRLGEPYALAEVAGDRDSGFLRLAVADWHAWALWTEPGAEKRVAVARMLLR
jgi:hypothetical protein